MLIVAVRGEEPAAVELLLEHGADVRVSQDRHSSLVYTTLCSAKVREVSRTQLVKIATSLVKKELSRGVPLCCVVGIADSHVEAWREGLNFNVLALHQLWEIVHRYAAVGFLGEEAAQLADLSVGTVSGLEEHDGRSVVGKGLGYGAGRAGRQLPWVGGGIHDCVQGVSSHDLMEVWRTHHSSVDQRGA
jgi:hypothetical protein